MATWTINHITGDTDTIDAARIDRYPGTGDYVATNDLGDVVAYIRADTLRSILRHQTGLQPVPAVVDESALRDKVRAILAEHDGRTVTALRRQFGPGAF